MGSGLVIVVGVRFEETPVSKSSITAPRIKDTLINRLASDLDCAEGSESSVVAIAPTGTWSKPCRQQ